MPRTTRTRGFRRRKPAEVSNVYIDNVMVVAEDGVDYFAATPVLGESVLVTQATDLVEPSVRGVSLKGLSWTSSFFFQASQYQNALVNLPLVRVIEAWVVLHADDINGTISNIPDLFDSEIEINPATPTTTPFDWPGRILFRRTTVISPPLVVAAGDPFWPGTKSDESGNWTHRKLRARAFLKEDDVLCHYFAARHPNANTPSLQVSCICHAAVCWTTAR